MVRGGPVRDSYEPPSYVRHEIMRHAMRCVARLVRMLLGASAIAEEKLACGGKFDILGVRLVLHVMQGVFVRMQHISGYKVFEKGFQV